MLAKCSVAVGDSIVGGMNDITGWHIACFRPQRPNFHSLTCLKKIFHLALHLFRFSNDLSVAICGYVGNEKVTGLVDFFVDECIEVCYIVS